MTLSAYNLGPPSAHQFCWWADGGPLFYAKLGSLHRFVSVSWQLTSTGSGRFNVFVVYVREHPRAQTAVVIVSKASQKTWVMKMSDLQNSNI